MSSSEAFPAHQYLWVNYVFYYAFIMLFFISEEHDAFTACIRINPRITACITYLHIIYLFIYLLFIYLQFYFMICFLLFSHMHIFRFLFIFIFLTVVFSSVAVYITYYLFIYFICYLLLYLINNLNECHHS